MKNRTKFDGLLFTGAIALALLITCRVFAQSAAPQRTAPDSSAPALRVSSRLVQVSVIVRHHGAPVTGLTKDDFTILDQNRPQQIADFSEQSYDPAAQLHTSPATAPSKTIFSNHSIPIGSAKERNHNFIGRVEHPAAGNGQRSRGGWGIPSTD